MLDADAVNHVADGTDDRRKRDVADGPLPGADADDAAVLGDTFDVAGLNYERNAGDSDMITPLVIAQLWPLRTWTSLKARALYQAEKLRDAATRSDGRLTLIRTKADLEQYLARRKQDPNVVAGLLAMEGLHPLEGDLANLDAFYDAGYRMLGLTHFFDNEVAGSAHGLEKGGLTELGRQVVRRMEERHTLVDLAHVALDEPRHIACS